uniref:Snake toxin/toxin-like domain-containing protein n=1 Tax=Leptobrachium leishanense TaxID=445787 RepID=A0A8C5MWT2_9ANUR
MLLRECVLLELQGEVQGVTSSLECFFCLAQTNAPDCVETKNCSAKEVVCKTIEYSAPATFPFDTPYVVTKDCAESCIPNDPSELGTDRPTYCCDKDFCNTRGLYSTCSASIGYCHSPGLLTCFISLALTLFRTQL